jgi:hypothetical protein
VKRHLIVLLLMLLTVPLAACASTPTVQELNSFGLGRLGVIDTVELARDWDGYPGACECGQSCRPHGTQPPDAKYFLTIHTEQGPHGRCSITSYSVGYAGQQRSAQGAPLFPTLPMSVAEVRERYGEPTFQIRTNWNGRNTVLTYCISPAGRTIRESQASRSKPAKVYLFGFGDYSKLTVLYVLDIDYCVDYPLPPDPS